jgi:hypothetical protein
MHRITSIIEESKLVSENTSPNVIHTVQFCVKHHQFHVFRTFLHRLLMPDKGSPTYLQMVSLTNEFFYKKTLYHSIDIRLIVNQELLSTTKSKLHRFGSS